MAKFFGAGLITVFISLFFYKVKAYLGGGLADETVLTPRAVATLMSYRIVDVSVGDNHIIG